MNILTILIPVTFFMGLFGLGAFFWCLRSGQYDDIAGAAERVLLNDAVKASPAQNHPARPADDTRETVS